MPLAKELQEIVDDLEFDNEEDRTAFEKVLSGKAGTKIQASYMKNKDYTTKTQAVADARKKLEAEQQRFNEEQDYYVSSLSTYKTDMEKRLNDALTQVSESKLYGAALETKLNQLAAQFGEDPGELLMDVKKARADDKPVDKKIDYDDEEFKKKYVPRDEFTQTAEAVFGYAPMLRDLDKEYSRLYGKEYDGSMQDLVKDASKEVQQRRSRGQQIDLYGYIREKLDFEGQKTRNAETQKSQAEEDRKKWEEDRRKEIEQEVRSQYLASNPGAAHQPKNQDAWRQNLTAGARKDTQNDQRSRSPQDTFKRQQDIHRAYEERASKQEGAS